MAPKPIAQPVGPFDDEQTVHQIVAQRQFLGLFRRIQPIEIDMRDRQAHVRHVIGLDDGEAGTGRFALQTQGFQYAARQRRLARAKPAFQRDDVADPGMDRNPPTQIQHRSLTAQLHHYLSHGAIRSPPWCPARLPTPVATCRHVPPPVAARVGGRYRPCHHCAPALRGQRDRRWRSAAARQYRDHCLTRRCAPFRLCRHHAAGCAHPCRNSGSHFPADGRSPDLSGAHRPAPRPGSPSTRSRSLCPWRWRPSSSGWRCPAPPWPDRPAHVRSAACRPPPVSGPAHCRSASTGAPCFAVCHRHSPVPARSTRLHSPRSSSRRNRKWWSAGCAIHSSYW
eukprot:Opistho-1_new@21130